MIRTWIMKGNTMAKQSLTAKSVKEEQTILYGHMLMMAEDPHILPLIPSLLLPRNQKGRPPKNPEERKLFARIVKEFGYDHENWYPIPAKIKNEIWYRAFQEMGIEQEEFFGQVRMVTETSMQCKNRLYGWLRKVQPEAEKPKRRATQKRR